MKNKLIDSFRRHTALYLAVVIVLLSGVVGLVVYAEYTKSSRAKRVIASYDTSGALFSSNRMREFTAGTISTVQNKVTFLADADDNPVTERITVCNYAQGNPGKVYDRDIAYKLHARLVKVEGSSNTPLTSLTSEQLSAIDAGLTVTLTYKDGTPVTLSKASSSADFAVSTMTRSSTGVTDVCIAEFSAAFNTDTSGVSLELYTELWDTANNAAADDDAVYPGIRNLEGLFTTDTSAPRNTWQGYFNDLAAIAASGTKLPSALDGYNYLITGNGEGTVTLSWDTSKLVLNMQNPVNVLPTFTDDSTTGTTRTVTFAVDSDVQSAYRLQFYRADGTSDSDFSAWATFKGYVTLTFAAPET